MLRFLASFALAVLFGLGAFVLAPVAGPADGAFAAEVAALDGASGSVDTAPVPADDTVGDATPEVSIDATVLSEGPRAPLALALADAAPWPHVRSAAALPYLEGLRRPPRA